MASTYPTALDTWATNKQDDTDAASGTDLGISTSVGDHATHHNDLADAVNKIETELGTAPSGADATVKDSIAASRRWYPVPSGGDDTAGLESEINALPATGGEIQLRSLDYNISALTSLSGQSNVTIRGVGVGRTEIKITSTTGNAIEMDGASFITWEDMNISQVSQRSAGSLFHLDDAAGGCQQNSFRRLWLLSSYRAFHLNDCGTTRIEDVQFGDVNDAWGWYSAIDCTGATVSTSVDRLRGGTAAGMSNGFVRLAGTTIDTFQAMSWDVLNYGIVSTVTTADTSTTVTGVTNTAAWRNGMVIAGAGIPANTTVVSGAGTATMVMSVAATASATVGVSGSDGMLGLIIDNGTWAKFTNVSIESGDKDAVTINGGIQTHFINPHLLGQFGAYIHGGTGTKLLGGNCVNTKLHSILMDGGTDTLISGMDIHDIGNPLGGSGWNGINVAANVSDFQIVDNTVGRAILGSTQPATGIKVHAGTSNNYRIRGNRCLNYTDGTATGVTDLGTGTNKDVGGNAGLTTGGYETGLKLPVRAGAIVNTTVSAPGATVDGVTMVAGDRMLLPTQTAPAENGIYIWNGAAAAATRAFDSDTAGKLTDSLLVTIDEGTVNKDSIFSLAVTKPITVGTSALRFTRVHPSYEQSSHPINSAYQPASSKLENLPRDTIGLTAQTGLTTQIIRVFPMGVLRAGDTLAALNFQVSLAAVTVTNSWAGIARLSDRVILAISPTSTAAPAINTKKTFTFNTPYTADKDETLIGFVMYQATTVPGFYGTLHGNASIIAEVPIMNGTSNTGQTTPLTVGATMTAFTAQPQMYYCFAT